MPGQPNSTFPIFKPNSYLSFVVGDLYKTEMSLARYEAGEINKINNVLAGAFLKTISDRTEETEETSTNEFESKQETSLSNSITVQDSMRQASQSVQSQSQTIDLGGEVSGSYGLVKFSAHGDFSSTNSKQKSRQDAKEHATEVVSESSQRTSERIRQESSKRSVIVQRNTLEAGFDNRGGDHVVGITRNIDEIYNVKLLNYNKHLFTNVIIANPAAHFRKYLESDVSVAATGVKLPTIKHNGNAIKASELDRENWLDLAAKYNLQDAAPPPEAWVSISGHIDFQSTSKPQVGHDAIIKTVTVPSGYIPKELNVACSGVVNDGSVAGARIYTGGTWAPISMSGVTVVELERLTGTNPYQWRTLLEGQGGNMDIGATCHNSYDAGITFDLQCECLDDSTHFKLWQLNFFQALIEAVQGASPDDGLALTENIGVAKIDISNNPLLARQFISATMKRCIIQQVLGTNLEGFEVLDMNGFNFPSYPTVNIPKLNALTPLIEFLDTVFDYEKMTVKYIDGFIGDMDNRVTSYEGLTPGPMKSFLESTFARVTLPISRFGEMEHKFRFFLLTNQVFVGEDVPVIDDPLSLAILNELDGTSTLDQADPEVIDQWEIKMPSAHAILQSGAKLPNFDVPDDLPGLVEQTQPTPSSPNPDDGE